MCLHDYNYKITKITFGTFSGSKNEVFQDDAAVLIGETNYIISSPSARNSLAMTWEEQICKHIKYLGRTNQAIVSVGTQLCLKKTADMFW